MSDLTLAGRTPARVAKHDFPCLVKCTVQRGRERDLMKNHTNSCLITYADECCEGQISGSRRSIRDSGSKRRSYTLRSPVEAH